MKPNPILRFSLTAVGVLMPVIIGIIGVVFFGWSGVSTFFTCLITYVAGAGLLWLLMLIWYWVFEDDYYLWKREQSERLNDEACKRTTRYRDDSDNWDDF